VRLVAQIIGTNANNLYEYDGTKEKLSRGTESRAKFGSMAQINRQSIYHPTLDAVSGLQGVRSQPSVSITPTVELVSYWD
jgi:hypothetical protein